MRAETGKDQCTDEVGRKRSQTDPAGQLLPRRQAALHEQGHRQDERPAGQTQPRLGQKVVARRAAHARPSTIVALPGLHVQKHPGPGAIGSVHPGEGAEDDREEHGEAVRL